MNDGGELILLCSECGSSFTAENARRVTYSLYGKHVERKVCPYCGSGHYSAEKDIEWLETLGQHFSYI